MAEPTPSQTVGPYFSLGLIGRASNGLVADGFEVTGRVLDGAGGMQAPHLVLLVFARGLLKPVLTRMYFPDEEEANAGDLVLSGVEDPAPLLAVSGPSRLEFDIRLQGEGAVVAFAV